LTIALNSILMNLCLPYWKSQGISCGLQSGDPGDVTELCEVAESCTYSARIKLF